MDDTEHSYMCKKSYYMLDYHFRCFSNITYENRSDSLNKEVLKTYVSAYHMLMMGIHGIKVDLFCRNTNGLEQWLDSEKKKYELKRDI